MISRKEVATMIGINNQILQLNFEEAQEEVAKLIALGYTDIILTLPTLINGEHDIEHLLSRFNRYRLGIKGIRYYIGNEIHYHYSMIHRLSQKEIISINNSKYLLLRLPKDKLPHQFLDAVEFLKDYTIILSSIEEYKYFSIHDLEELQKKGIQLMANLTNIKKGRLQTLLRKQLIDYLVFFDDINPTLLALAQKKTSKIYFDQITRHNFLKNLDLDL
ncbi:MAG: CpsB/CapC family capsule biosynthesis tyrosine phosphatase [Bacilli bacterium]|jgi:tyrosine-protein phosphatase YwqE|nr:CpsB/CapC family capsule biosynthesis tyrosine phosphatase [Bacilli bacterium]